MGLHSCTRLSGWGWGGFHFLLSRGPTVLEALALKTSQLPFSVLPRLAKHLQCVCAKPSTGQAGRHMIILKGISWCHFHEGAPIGKPDFQLLPVPTDLCCYG